MSVMIAACWGHKNIWGVKSEILLRTEAAEGVLRQHKVTQSFLELPTMLHHPMFSCPQFGQAEVQKVQNVRMRQREV